MIGNNKELNLELKESIEKYLNILNLEDNIYSNLDNLENLLTNLKNSIPSKETVLEERFNILKNNCKWEITDKIQYYFKDYLPTELTNYLFYHYGGAIYKSSYNNILIIPEYIFYNFKYDTYIYVNVSYKREGKKIYKTYIGNKKDD